jgi:branched-chain amino acid transport system permease protein/neutral amino acid transport system permease protein
MTIGAYAALAAMLDAHLSFAAAALIAAIVTALLGLVSYLIVFRPHESATVTLFITSIGLALIFRAAVQMIWGGDILAYPGVEITPIDLGFIVIPGGDGVVIVTCALVVAAFFLLLHKTRLGREIRATASDTALARTYGLDVRQITLAVWVCAALLIGIAGVLLGMSTALSPEMGWNLLLPAFAAAILGGLGNTTGAAIGGLTIGIAMQLAVIVAPAGYKPGVAFAIMIVMLLVRPAGILANKHRR